jgi:hypothetical protein
VGLTGADTAATGDVTPERLAESIGLALLVVLDSLSPAGVRKREMWRQGTAARGRLSPFRHATEAGRWGCGMSTDLS